MVGLLAAGGALALTPLGLLVRQGAELPATLKLTTLSPMEAATLLAAWRAVLPKEDQQRFVGGEAGFLTEVDGVFAHYPPHLLGDLRLALALARFSPIFSLKARPLHKLDAVEARDVLDKLLNSSLLAFRQVGEAMVQLTHYFYYGNPGAWAPLGYDGPWVKS